MLVCPNCKSPRLQKAGFISYARGKRGEPREVVEKQRYQCQDCKRFTINPEDQAGYIHKCLRCDHQWTSKKEHLRQCPKCGSAYWDAERVRR